MTPHQPPTLDATFAALSDPTRRAILARLASGEASVMELAEPFADEPARDLEAPQGARAGRAGLARARRAAAAAEGRGQALREVARVARAHSGEFWDESYKALDAVLEGAQGQRHDKGRKMMSDTSSVTGRPVPSIWRLAMSRVFDAPQQLVFDAYTRPELLTRWLGLRNGWTFAVL